MLGLIKTFFANNLSNDVGIDLGTSNTVVYVRGKGIVLTEPSVVAIRKGTGKVAMDGTAVGMIAKKMLGKGIESIEAVRPLKDGAITDFEIVSQMIRYFIKRVDTVKFGFGPRVVLAVPSGSTRVERKAAVSAAEAAGARKVFIVEEPLAAAIGAGIPIGESKSFMVADIGGGTTEMGIFNSAGYHAKKSIRVAGDEFDESIVDYIYGKHNLRIGPSTGERIKIEIGSAYPLEKELATNARGKDGVNGQPRQIALNSQEIRGALQKPVRQIVEAVKELTGSVAPEVSADLYENGLILAGGSCMLRGLDRFLAHELKLPVRRCENPLEAVARGAGTIIENLDLYKSCLESEQDYY